MINIIKKHIKQNLKNYLLLFAILLIGIFIGIIVINNSNSEQKNQISNYVNDFTKELKNNKIDYVLLLKKSIKSNIKIVIIILLISLSLFGTIGGYAICLYKGFSLGYSISSIIAVFGVSKGLIFAMSLILFSQMIYIPAIFYMITASNKFYKTIIYNDYDDKKIEIIRYFITIFIGFILLTLSSLVETFINSNLLLGLLNFITT